MSSQRFSSHTPRELRRTNVKYAFRTRGERQSPVLQVSGCAELQTSVSNAIVHMLLLLRRRPCAFFVVSDLHGGLLKLYHDTSSHNDASFCRCTYTSIRVVERCDWRASTKGNSGFLGEVCRHDDDLQIRSMCVVFLTPALTKSGSCKSCTVTH